MHNFIHDNFLLQTDQAIELYNNYAKDQPIIDYHCHLDPSLIATDHQFKDLTEIWLEGDHYKWRAMRANGVSEEYCTGDKSPKEKFRKWAETVPNTLGNPLYHWTHLELTRYFGITDLLCPENADEIYSHCNEQLSKPEFSCQSLLKKMKVKVVCTTDDPIDDLISHDQIARLDPGFKVLPTFRPDRVANVSDTQSYSEYLEKLEGKSGFAIKSYNDLLQALELRHSYFHSRGCRLSDHGLTTFYGLNPSPKEQQAIFLKIRNHKTLSYNEKFLYQCGILLDLAGMDFEKGWVQQFHFGALRNNNRLMFEKLGPDTGFDSISDNPVAAALSRFLDQLALNGQLTKTILYNLNPSHNHVVAAMTGNFQDGTVPGKIQFGSGWWFLDQKDGMEQQLNVLSNLGLLSHFVGMLTDSRSFMSYTRHEYFRRILCNLLGNEMNKGLLPDDVEMVGQLVARVAYGNAREYFGFFD
ncbi:MAG: glucuronate isomerase [Bacteroidales bacterium]|nr:glucuronate isomerase [Bacteroidales bacterium]